MEIKLSILALALTLLAGSMAVAQESGDKPDKEAKFLEFKTQMLQNLNEDKAGLDHIISCVNSAQKRDDMEKCHAMRKADMEKSRSRNLAERKSHLEKEQQHLQNKLQKLNSEPKK